MTKTFLGTVHGKTIELTQELGLPDGQQVEITVWRAKPQGPEPWGEGLRRCAGTLADSWGDEDDQILEEIHKERNSDTRRQLAD